MLMKIDKNIWYNFTTITLQKSISFCNIILSVQEKAFYKKINHKQKKIEWLAARYLLQKLFNKLNLTYYGLNKSNSGAPYALFHDIGISISHSYPFVIVMVNTSGKIGTDIQVLNTKLISIQTRYLQKKELVFMKDNLFKLTLAWSAKEAIYKLYTKKISLRDDILVMPFFLQKKGIITCIIHNQLRLNVYYIITDVYIWCYCCN